MTAYTPVQCQSCGHPVPDETCPGSTDAEVGLTEELRVQKRALACKGPACRAKARLALREGSLWDGGAQSEAGPLLARSAPRPA